MPSNSKSNALNRLNNRDGSLRAYLILKKLHSHHPHSFGHTPSLLGAVTYIYLHRDDVFFSFFRQGAECPTFLTLYLFYMYALAISIKSIFTSTLLVFTKKLSHVLSLSIVIIIFSSVFLGLFLFQSSV